jgi:PEP-CTERM motif-containing protein
MKRNIAAVILGIASAITVVGSAHAQGRIFFSSYNITTDAQVTYTPGGAGINNTYTAGLWYFLGTATLSAGAGAGVLPSGWEIGNVTAQYATAAPVGYFNGPVVNISDYVSGPITFVVTAYNGADYNSSPSRAHSAAFTLPSIATGTTGAGEFGPGFTSFSIVPEPSIFALSGLGAAALMLIRHKR